MKKRLLLTLLPLSFLVAACGGNAPAEASSSRATGSSTSAVKSSESSAEQTSSQATDLSSSQAGGESTSAEPESSSTEPAAGTVYTVTETNDDWGTKPFEVQIPTFAHYWDGVNPGKWVPLEYTAGEGVRSATFTVPSEDAPVAFLIVRCAEGTTTPDWEIKTGDAAGRIYNKTENVDFVEGTTEYSILFVDYPGND